MTTEQIDTEVEAIADFHDQALAEIARLTAIIIEKDKEIEKLKAKQPKARTFTAGVSS